MNVEQTAAAIRAHAAERLRKSEKVAKQVERHSLGDQVSTPVADFIAAIESDRETENIVAGIKYDGNKLVLEG